MDGNGRWARSRGLPRLAGHHAGAGSVRKVVESAPDLGIKILTLYAFSSDNWKRPIGEVRGLMRLFRAHLASETPELQKNGVRLRVIGRRDRLPDEVLKAIDDAERATSRGRRLELRVAVDYSARDTLLAAIRQARSPEAATRGGFERVLGAAMNLPEATSDVDLLIRTGGEQRLSDFMLWECCYAEMLFSPKHWPEFSGVDLAAAVAEFQHRERRFGTVPEVAAARAEQVAPQSVGDAEEEEIAVSVGGDAEANDAPTAYVAAPHE